MFLIVMFLAIIFGFVSLVIVVILGRTRMKEVDKYVYGHNFEHDSIFFQIARLPQYTTVFSSRWYAKRTGQLEFYEHFDKKFKQPFLFSFYFAVLSGFFIFITWVIQGYYL
ncbi:MAG TPA: hypothetical protein ENI64_04150 [Gammaproteobacteria bacterium]|nr:hypothetical protein [Gammaproteobacteria bacterium]